MFGGGNGSFAVAQASNPFGGSAQASPANPFQGGGGFQNDGASFGGRGGGGRNSFSSRGGRTPSRGGGRSGGRSIPAYQADAFGGGAYQGDPFAGPAYQGDTFGAPTFGGGGRGRGRGRGRGAAPPVVTSGGMDNPFASPAASPNGFGGSPPTPNTATTFGRGSGGRNGGRSDGGTTFGGAAMMQPNIRRRPDAGGRGPRTPNTTFGQAAPFVPPLPPSSPPPLGPARKPGRGGGIVAQVPSSPALTATPAMTAFGQQANSRPKGRIAPTVEASAPPNGINPFGSGAVSNTPTRTAFGMRDTSANGFDPSGSRPARDKRQPNAFAQQSAAFQDGGFQPPSNALEARFTGAKVWVNPQLRQPAGEESTTFGRHPRNKGPVNNDHQDDSSAGMVPTLKPKKKMMRNATPNSSPPLTPAPGSPAHGPGDYQVIGDQKNKAELSSAANLNGTCIDMCSPAERELHIRVDELSLFEKCFPGEPGHERDLIVKRFQRSSADHKLDIPSELRPLGVLRRTQLYLEQQIMDRERLGPDPRFAVPRLPELIELYNFCWDRFRMIRKDFVLQNYRGAGGRVHPIAIDVHERIARYHILSEHELCEVPSFVAQQNMEQLGQTLKSLNELYDESRKLSDPAYLSPFEAELRGYFILCTLDNGRGSDVLKFVKGLAPQVREAAQVKFAMQVFVARHTQNYYAFFNLLRQATYLQACLVFRYIPSMRSLALERLNRANRNQPYPLGDLVELLCFDDFEHAESVCAHHGLDISTSEEAGGDGEPVVNFGGEFESDIQLRQNKKPLPVRASHVYISQKQGDFLRGDVCRGVTEYEQQDYPPLSKLIEDTENAERLALYPDRPVEEDEYSAFAVYTSDPFDSSDRIASARSPGHHRAVVIEHHPRTVSTTDPDERQYELDAIARKKAEVELTKIKMMERIQQLEREKEEKKRQTTEAESAAREAKKREAEEKARVETELARQQRELQEKQQADEEARRKRQLELEAQERQRAEAAKAAAEQARQAEVRRLAEERRQAEEAQRRRELQIAEEERRRQAAAEAERRRQLELAAERERLEREAKRQAALALEAARRKQAQRIKKQRLAVMRLRFHVWRKFVTQSKTLPRDVKMGATSLVEQSTTKPSDVMEWLFGGPRSAADFIGTQCRKFDMYSRDSDAGYSPPPKTLWQPLEVASIVGQHARGSGQHATGWKFVVADLLDDGLSSFGSWCAVKCGIASALIEDEDNISTVFCTNWSDTSNLGVCCRYLSANFLQSLSAHGREKRLAGASAIMLPLDLSHALDPTKLQRWEERVGAVLVHVHPSRRVSVMVLGFCASRTARRGDALAAAEASIQRIMSDNQGKVAFIDGELVLEDDLFSSEVVNDKITGVLTKLASTDSSQPGQGHQVVDLADVMDAVVHEALLERSETTSGVMEIQDRLHTKLWKLRDALFLPSVIDTDIPIPELQATLNAPVYGWNSREAQQHWDALFKTLTTHKIIAYGAPLAPFKVCEVYFEQISQLVDSLYSHRIATSGGVSINELKQSLFGLLVPIHEELLKQGDSAIPDASRLLPWRQIFGHIYSAFIECLGEELLYMPAELIESYTRRSDMGRPLFVAGTIAGRPRRRSAPLDASAHAAAVAFARRELKRALVDQSLPPAQANGIKRLRHEITRERAAAQSFQQFLRREVERWSISDEALPSS